MCCIGCLVLVMTSRKSSADEAGALYSTYRQALSGLPSVAHTLVISLRLISQRLTRDDECVRVHIVFSIHHASVRWHQWTSSIHVHKHLIDEQHRGLLGQLYAPAPIHIRLVPGGYVCRLAGLTCSESMVLQTYTISRKTGSGTADSHLINPLN